MSVYSYFHAIVVSGFHDGADFILGHLWAGAVGAKVHDAARRHGFDEVSPFLIVQADYLPRFIGAIEYRLEGAGVALQIHAEPVGMIGVAAGGADRGSRSEDARPDHCA